MSRSLPLHLGQGQRRVLLDLIDHQAYLGAHWSPLNPEQLEQLRAKLLRPLNHYTPEELEHLHRTATDTAAELEAPLMLPLDRMELLALRDVVRRIEDLT